MIPTCIACLMRAEEYCLEVALSFAEYDDIYWEFHQDCTL